VAAWVWSYLLLWACRFNLCPRSRSSRHRPRPLINSLRAAVQMSRLGAPFFLSSFPTRRGAPSRSRPAFLQSLTTATPSALPAVALLTPHSWSTLQVLNSFSTCLGRATATAAPPTFLALLSPTATTSSCHRRRLRQYASLILPVATQKLRRWFRRSSTTLCRTLRHGLRAPRPLWTPYRHSKCTLAN
jgi:hypothetical protein